ncbi:Asp23/Gls24 family envelope stress response protein [Streptomyces sp. MMBL 11-3]|uniref:Asp23/Gls24 family envelope stress response protein n=1 Tax=Streptomyces sp. MMBL 11-3 TaxID=3382639 RepID=UPI0039B5D017
MTAHTDPSDAHSGSPHTGDVHDDERLPCGRLLSQVWDDWERGPADTADPHLRTCPHCRRSVRGLDELESAVRDLRDETTDTSVYDTTSLTQRVMDVVRLELRPGRPLSLGEPAEDLWIMESVAARTLRAAAESVSGVRAGSCRLLPLHISDGTGGPVVEVSLALHAPARVPLPELADQVRGRVREAADRELGLAIGAVDIRVTDLIDTTADSQEGETR